MTVLQQAIFICILRLFSLVVTTVKIYYGLLLVSVNILIFFFLIKWDFFNIGGRIPSQKQQPSAAVMAHRNPCGCCAWQQWVLVLAPRGVIPQMIFPAQLCKCSCSLADLLSAYCQWLPEAMHQELALKWPPVAL